MTAVVNARCHFIEHWAIAARKKFNRKDPDIIELVGKPTRKCACGGDL